MAASVVGSGYLLPNDVIYDEIIAADTLICRLGNSIMQRVASSEEELENLKEKGGSIFLNAVLEKGDPRISMSTFLAPKKDEISGPMEKETFRKVHYFRVMRTFSVGGLYTN